MESISKIENCASDIRRKAKKLLALAMMTFAVSSIAVTVKAQTFAEWFKQKSTQKKYLLQQIAALQVYAGYVKQGNSIARNGLGSITGSLSAENLLHTTYYNKLKKVNPLVKNNKQVADILQWQNDILKRFSKLDKISGLTVEERQYTIKVKTSLFKDCNEEMTELQNVISNNQLEISDQERLKHIGVIHVIMQDNYRFASVFTNQVQVYANQKKDEKNNVVTERSIYGLQ